MVKEKTISEQISNYLIAMRKREIPDEVKRAAKCFLADTFACIIAGANEKPAIIAGEYAETVGAKKVSSVLGRKDKRTDAYHCAMINGIAAHFHDYDDVCTTMIGHPSVAVLPAVLSLGEELHASGEKVLRAYITGVETCALLGRAYVPELCRRGWHSTSALGVFGAAAASALLLDLDEVQLTNAIGIAASESGGLKGNTGSMTKPLHAGRAAAKGIMASRLAKLGYTSNRTIMEMDAGFMKVLAESFHKERFEEAMRSHNSEFLNVGLIMKPWPACKATHNGIWAMLQLMEEKKFTPDEIAHIDCKVLPYAMDILRYRIARTKTEGKFSMNYCIALIVLQKKLMMEDFEGDEVTDSRVIDMMNRIEMVSDNTLIPGAYFDDLESTQVEVKLKSGELLVKRCDYAKGGPNNPMSRTEMHEKWRNCMERAVSPYAVSSIIEMLEHIESLKDIGELAVKVEKAANK